MTHPAKRWVKLLLALAVLFSSLHLLWLGVGDYWLGLALLCLVLFDLVFWPDVAWDSATRIAGKQRLYRSLAGLALAGFALMFGLICQLGASCPMNSTVVQPTNK